MIRTAFDHGYLWLAFLTVDGVESRGGVELRLQK